MDILRTLAHELTHYRQHERLGKSMPDSAGRTGSPYENEANAQAGIVMRHFQNRYPEFFASTVSEDGDSVNAQYGDQTPPGPESPPTMPQGTLRVDVSDMYDWYKIGQHIANMKGLGRHDFGAGPPSSIISFGDEDTEHKFIKDLEATGLDVTDIDPQDPQKRPGGKIKTDPTYNVDESTLNEFSTGPGQDGNDYLRALASAWYNGTFDTGSLQKGIKSQEDVERLLQRGIICPDGKIRKYNIGYNANFDGVEIYSDDYYEYGDHDDTIDSRTGQKWGPYEHIEYHDSQLDEGIGKALGTAAVAGALALGGGGGAKAQDAGRVAYQIGKQIYQPSGIFTRAGAEEELKGMARDLARDIRTGGSSAKFLGRTILAQPLPGGERVAANGVGATPEAAFQDALNRAYTDANRRFGPVAVGDWRPIDSEKEIERVGGQYRAAVVLQGPAPVREDASGYIPTKKQARDPRFKTALTVDIKPGQLGKEANKLGLKTDSQGRPDLLMKNLANALKEYKETGVFEAVKPVTPVLKSTSSRTQYPPLPKQKSNVPQDKPRDRVDGTGKIIDYEIKEDELFEVKMSPSALEAWANSPEAEGIRAGFEAEMIFRDTKRDDDQGEQEPDYDYDTRPDSIEEVIDFFSNDDYGYGLSSRGARSLREELQNEFIEWADEQIAESWDESAEDQTRDYMENNVWGDDSERENRIQNKIDELFPDDDSQAILAAGESAPRFTRSSDQTAYTEQNDLYAKYKEASDAAYEEFEEEVISEYENQGDYYDNAREYYFEMMRDSGDYDESEFLRSKYGYMSEISSSFDLDWPYWTGGSSGYGERDWEDIGDSLRRAVGMEVKVGSGYHSTTRKENRWIIEPDGSLDPDDYEDAGLEIVSPPMPLPMALDKLKTVIEWGNNTADAYTNDSTGLHMGVSIPYVGGDVDYVKLVLFMGDEYVLEKFGRASNTYTASAMQKLRQNMGGARNRGELTEAKLDPMGALELVQKNLIELAARYVQDGVGRSKYTSAHIKDGYIEFRSPGGDYLAMESRGEYDDIKNTMLRFARAMYIAGRPDLERREYAKKLYKLISPGAQNDALKLFADYAAGTITPEQLKKQWADAVLQKELPSTGKEEYEVFDMNKKDSPDGVIDTFYARNYDDAYDQYTKKYIRDPRWSQTDVRAKMPWFDVMDADEDIVLTVRARDIDQAKQKAEVAYGGSLEDNEYKIFRRPDNTPEPKLSVRAQVAKRIKEPKVTPAVAADNKKDSQQIQARIGEPQPVGQRSDPYQSVPIPGLTDVELDIEQNFTAQGTAAGEFTGAWRVLNRNGEEVYRFSGIGNNQGDANRRAQTWLVSQGSRFDDQGPFNVYPVMG
jgi:hypothetical protein